MDLSPYFLLQNTQRVFFCDLSRDFFIIFQIDDEHILLGSYAGALNWFNIHTGAEESNTECHHSAITGIEQSKVNHIFSI